MLDAAALPPTNSASLPSSTLDREGQATAVFARVEVHRDPAGVLAAWEHLEGHATISPYQTRRWLLPWIESTAQATGVSPFLVLAYDLDDQPVALLPLGLWRQGFLTVCGFLGGKDSNFNLGLFRSDKEWSRAEIHRLFRTAAHTSGVTLDLIALANQPHEWDGVPNPLSHLPRQPSPSFAYKVALTRDPEEYLNRNLSRESRKKLRQKTTRMTALGPVAHRMAVTAVEAASILDAFVAQRTDRSAALGLSAAELPGQRRFLEHAFATSWPSPAVELHALFCGDRIVATFAGTVHKSRFCGMVMSFDSDPGLLRTSPGELLLASLIRTKCESGLTTFDLGIGEARYKDTYCPDPEPLFDSLLAISAKGSLFASVERLRLLAKRSIKQSAWAWKLVRVLRKARRTLSGRVAVRAGPGKV